MQPETAIYRARKVCRCDGSLLDDGAVACRNGRIVAIERWSGLRQSEARVVDLGDVLLLPGLINAHAHLQLSHLKDTWKPTSDFVGWLGKIALRIQLSRSVTLQRAAQAGARQLLEGGVTAAVEIDYDGRSAETLRSSPLRLVFAYECIDLNPERAEQVASQMLDIAGQLNGEPLRRRRGLAPHAPYSVNQSLWESFARELKARPTFLTVHMAESAEEDEMFREGRGTLVERFRLLRLLPRGWKAPRCSPIEFIERTGVLDTPGLAVHCGFADEDDARRLARGGWTVAFCPGTHEYFQRPPFPLERFRRAGVPVCLGTDSAASNTTGLSMMAEMQRLARWFPQLSAAEVVAAATSIPAQAIGWGDAVGRTEIGCCADFSAWSPCPDGDRLDRSWFESAAPTCTATIIAGQEVRYCET